MMTGKSRPEPFCVGGGTRIASGTGSFATIELVDGSRLVLQPDSRIKLDELSRHRYAETTETRLRLERGRLESVVVKTPRAPHFGDHAHHGRRARHPFPRCRRGTPFRPAAPRSPTALLPSAMAAKGTTVPAGYGVSPGRRQVSPPIALLPAPESLACRPCRDRTIARFVFPPVAGARQYRLQIGADADMRTGPRRGPLGEAGGPNSPTCPTVNTPCACAASTTTASKAAMPTRPSA
ncbi:MAG: FecR domain-containing protein [Rhodocyclaceae bacterium]|nr:FecR domain-containing protein [Rhodocyclaceae bacterium]